jgi:hypothetical protein
MTFGPELSEEEIEVMKRYTGYFAEFAKFGQPTHGNASAHYNYYWRPYFKENGQYMVTDVPVRSHNFANQCSKKLDRFIKYNTSFYFHK